MSSGTVKPPSAGLLISTKVLVLSDTHGMNLSGKMPSQYADLCIHCGDLIEESKLDEFRATMELLRSINAPLKLVIAGNHDFTLNTPSFKKKIAEAKPRLEPELVAKFYGEYDEARGLLLNSKKDGIHFLDEGTHQFSLQNGAKLTIYASPYTPSLGDWGFQYRPHEGHDFKIEQGTDIVVTHGPPLGIMDRTSSRERAGCPDLFAALALSKPQMHCFGHIHEAWGAKMITWREMPTEKPSHLTDIDNEKSFVIEQLSTIRDVTSIRSEVTKRKEENALRYAEQKCYDSGRHLPELGKQTIFVNASIKGGNDSAQLPWLVEVQLPKAEDKELDKSHDSHETGEATLQPKKTKKRPIDTTETESDGRSVTRQRLSSSGTEDAEASATAPN